MLEAPDLNPDSLSAHAAANREKWNSDSDTYQSDHGAQLAASGGLAWGVWQIPEARLCVLGEVGGRDILELGCGAAQWSIALSKQGARPVGLDISERQLDHARRLMREARVDFPLVHASAEAVPLRDRSFDIVFCDYGAMTFADPYLSVPEVARLLRPGGLFAFCGATPVIEMCYPEDSDHPGDRLLNEYFGMWSLLYEGYTEFMLPHGAWIRLFRAHGFAVEDLIELRPGPDDKSSYRDDKDREWYRRWPGEQIWKVRREGLEASVG
jgi:SAM-dependent methyltransferase